MIRLEERSVPGYERVVMSTDPDAGLTAIVSVHSTVLGPGLGGTRFYPFPTMEDALADVLRLSRAMTYKNAAAGLDFGGGKAVIVGNPRTDRTEDLIRAYARTVDALEGMYVTAEDVGTTTEDMNLIRTVTPHVTGTSPEFGGSGDPSEATAFGVFRAMEAVAERIWGTASVSGRHVAISGVGKVGGYLAGYLSEAGARLTVADVSAEAVDRAVSRFGAEVVEPDRIHAVDCDVYSPCALGGALSEQTIPELRCAAVVGCANNQLDTPGCGDLVASRGIVYAPDYVVNAGGVINLANEVGGYDRERAFAQVARIADNVRDVLERADRDGVTTAEAADALAEARLARSG